MTTREKILLGMAGVAAIAAVVILLIPSGSSRPVPAAGAPGSMSSSLAGPTGATGGAEASGPPQAPQAPQAIVEQARKTLAEAVVTQSQLYVLDAATRQAAPNPFHPLPGKGDGMGGAGGGQYGKDGKSAAHDIAFTGYVAIGNSVLAILDGLEYRVGETVADTGYVVKSITPGKVVLASPGDVTDREIPYSGDDL